MAKTVKEAALLLEVISGPDRYDSTVLDTKVPKYTELNSVKSLKIGVPIEYFGEGVGVACRKKDKDLVELINKAIDQIRADGTYKKIQDKYFDFNVYGE